MGIKKILILNLPACMYNQREDTHGRRYATYVQ